MLYRTSILSTTVRVDEPTMQLEPANPMTPAEFTIELASRLCYNSIDKIGTNPNFINGLIKAGHMDVLEHAVAAFEIEYRINTVVSTHIIEHQFHRLVVDFRHLGHLDVRTRFIDDGKHSIAVTVRIGGNLRTWYEILYWYAVPYDSPELQAALNDIYTYLSFLAPNIFNVKPRRPVDFYTVEDYRADALVNTILKTYDKKFILGHLHGELEIGLVTPIAYSHHFLTNNDVYQHYNHMSFWVDGVSRAFSHQHVRHRLLSFCLAEDTIIRSYGSKKWTIKQLYDWSNDSKRSGRLKLIKLRGMNDKGEIVPATIKKIVHSGMQQVYRLTTKSGRSIRATALHRFYTPNGWKHLQELSTGDMVYSNGVPAYKDEEYLRQRYLVENTERKVLAAELGVADATLGRWIRRFGLQKPKSQYPGRKGNPNGVTQTAEVREKISNKMKGENNHRWKGDDISDGGGRVRANKMYSADTCEECGSNKRVQRHHIDGNPTNNNPSNIAILCEDHHQAWHKIGKLLAFKDEIVSIEVDEIVDTYDIEINEEFHNFVADGIVVHNSQISQRYVDFTKKQMGEFIYPPGELTDEQMDILANTFDTIEDGYIRLRNAGMKKEDARCVLPNAATTSLIFSGYKRGLEHYIDLRTASDAQFEIREVAKSVEQLYRMTYP